MRDGGDCDGDDEDNDDNNDDDNDDYNDNYNDDDDDDDGDGDGDDVFFLRILYKTMIYSLHIWKLWHNNDCYLGGNTYN